MVVSVNTNVAAMRGQHRLSRAVNHQTVSMERLSSGHKIHSAKDDPAGLQISNRLQAQNRGLDVAIRNANDGISMLQTAEGAMAEYTDNLTRMRDLTLRYMNDGSVSSEDRDAIRQEFNALKDELNRIAETTSYGGEKLLNGHQTNRSFQIGSSSGEGIQVAFPNLSERVEKTTTAVDKRATVSMFNSNWRAKSGDTLGFYDYKNRDYLADRRLEIEAGDSMEDVVERINDELGDKLTAFIRDNTVHAPKTVKELVVYPVDDDSGYYPHGGTIVNESILRPSYSVSINVDEVTENSAYLLPNLDEKNGGEFVIYQLDGILQNVDSIRAVFGAAQNRLSHAINNLSQASENVAASNSQIRDTDFAKETSALAKESILKEVNTAMLAQASNIPQGAISLLS